MMGKKAYTLLTISLLMLGSSCILSLNVDGSKVIGSKTETLYSVSDTFVNSSSPDANYGNEVLLYVGATSEYEYTYVMFDLSSIPSGATIISATLELYLQSKDGEIYGFPADSIGAFYCSAIDWTEIEITWTNKPDLDPYFTATWSFGFVYYVREYKAWNITEDVKKALPSGKLAEALRFQYKTGNGRAIFQSEENDNGPKLVVEYATESIFPVHFESIQDTEASTNFGFVNIADYESTVPSDVDVVSGTYPVAYTGGYMFMRWETTGNLVVHDATASVTNVTVSGSGTLRAVGNNRQLEYSYDHGHPTWLTESAGNVDAVRFTPLFSGQLLKARFYIMGLYQHGPNAFKVHVMDENRTDLIPPLERTPVSQGWYDVDFASYGIRVDEGIDFYAGIEWMSDNNPDFGKDITQPSNRSYHWNQTDWTLDSKSDFVIRVVVGTLIDHAVSEAGTVFHVLTESNSTISGFQFAKEDKKLFFDASGPPATSGSCNLTIPNQLLGGPFNVTCDGNLVDEVVSGENGTHTWLSFIYAHSGHRLEITGTTAIPEFSSPLLLAMMMVTIIIAAIMQRKRTSRVLNKVYSIDREQQH